MSSTKDFSRTGGRTVTMLLAVYAFSSMTAVLARSATATLSSSSSSSASSPVPSVNTLTPSKPYRGAPSTHLHRTDEQTGAVADAQQAKSQSAGESSIWSELEFVYSTYQQCSNVDLSVCLKLKLVSALNGAARSMQNIEPVEGIRFVSLNGRPEAGAADAVPAAVSDEELLATLPRSVEGQESALSSMIWDRIAAFFQTHTVQVS